MKRTKNSLYASAALLIFSLLMIFYAIPTQISVKALLGGNSTIVNSRFFPYIVSGLVGVLSAVELTASAIRLSRLAKEGKKDEAKAPPRYLDCHGGICPVCRLSSDICQVWIYHFLSNRSARCSSVIRKRIFGLFIHYPLLFSFYGNS